MTAQKIINALPIVQKLMEVKLPTKKAFQVYSLAKQINEHREFFINEEKKLIEKFQGSVNEQGFIQFETPEKQSEFAIAYDELLNYTPEGINAVELSFSSLEDAAFTPIELGFLEGLINFID